MTKLPVIVPPLYVQVGESIMRPLLVIPVLQDMTIITFPKPLPVTDTVSPGEPEFVPVLVSVSVIDGPLDGGGPEDDGTTVNPFHPLSPVLPVATMMYVPAGAAVAIVKLPESAPPLTRHDCEPGSMTC